MFINKKLFKAIICLLALFFAGNAKSQTSKTGTWEVLNTEYYLSKKWNLWMETQLRSQQVFSDFFYHELKGGINFKLKKDVAFLFGAGQYGTYSNGGNFKTPVVSHEFRIWEQVTLTNNISRIKIEHRYRIEQRWINGIYRNRFRYRLNPIVPINKPTVVKGTLFASVFDEIFLTNKPSYFERNRFFAGVGFMISQPFTLQVGWLRQFDYSLTNPGSRKNFLHTTLFIRLNKSAGNQESHPGPID